MKSKEHTENILKRMADSFLVSYFVLAHSKLQGELINPRLFSMGHALELYLKASSVDDSGQAVIGHELSDYLKRFDSNLYLSDDEILTGKTLFNPALTNFDGGLYYKHQEALELYQVLFFLRDIKYQLNKDMLPIYPVRVSMKPINERFLKLVSEIRNKIDFKSEKQDKELIAAIGKIGFEDNPIQKYITLK